MTSVFGTLFRTDRQDADARVGPGDVTQQLLKAPGAVVLRTPELKWLGSEDGRAVLVYEAFVSTGVKSEVIYIDANTGAELMRTSLIHTQSSVGEGTGVLGDRKTRTSSSESGFRWTTCSGRRCC